MKVGGWILTQLGFTGFLFRQLGKEAIMGRGRPGNGPGPVGFRASQVG